MITIQAIRGAASGHGVVNIVLYIIPGGDGGSGGGGPRNSLGGLAVTPPANLIPGMTF
jgi:hypothetical protein